MDIEMKKCQIEDEQVVYELVSELQQELLARAYFHKVWLVNRQGVDKQCYLVYYRGVPCAFASLSIRYPLHHSFPVAEIEEFIVKEEFRHQGIGSYMFSQLISMAQACEAQLLELSSKDTSTQAHVFYRKHEMTMRHYKFTLDIGKKT